MAMVKNTKILILDEPFAALDPQSVRNDTTNYCKSSNV